MQLSHLALLPALWALTSASPIPEPASASDSGSTPDHPLVARFESGAAAGTNSHLAARGYQSHTGVLIVSNATGKCLSVAYQSRYPNNGDAIVTVDCKAAKLWDIYQDGSVVMHDFNNMPGVASGYAIDAGSNVQNGGTLKIWTSYPGLKAQTWHTSNSDKRNFSLGIVGTNQCMDNDNGKMQTWQCYQGNQNQSTSLLDPSVSSTPLISRVPPCSNVNPCKGLILHCGDGGTDEVGFHTEVPI